MAQQAILDTIDREIAKLQQVRNILEGKHAGTAAPDAEDSAPKLGKRPGPPRASSAT